MKIGVIGLGLIGGSIFKALSNRYDVIGVSSSVEEKNVSKDYETLKDCDLVFVCTPMSATLEILDKETYFERDVKLSACLAQDTVTKNPERRGDWLMKCRK